MDFLKNFNYINENSKKLCEEFITNINNRYVLGRNKWADSIIDNMEINGIVDDFTDDKIYKGYKIYKANQLPKDAIVISATMGGPQTAKKRLDNLSIKNLDYFAFYKYICSDLLAPPFIIDFKNDFLENKNRYFDIYKQLSDQKSKDVFKNILNFKITLDLLFLKDYSNDILNQYFEDNIYKMPKKPIFVDGGGYIGDTSMIFIDKYKEFDSIYLFEPTKSNLQKAKDNLKSFNNIHFIEAGLSNKNAEVFFNEDDASGAISENGTITIDITTIDSAINKKIDFIKLDIEGAEQDAIEGAKNTIIEYNPILAICIYIIKLKIGIKFQKRFYN